MIATQPPGNPTGNEPVPLLSCSNSCPTDTQKSGKHTQSTRTRDAIIPALMITTPRNEEMFVRKEQTNELFLPLNSTVVFIRKQEMLYVPLYLENSLTVDTLVDSGAYVSAIALEELDT